MNFISKTKNIFLLPILTVAFGLCAMDQDSSEGSRSNTPLSPHSISYSSGNKLLLYCDGERHGSGVLHGGSELNRYANKLHEQGTEGFKALVAAWHAQNKQSGKQQ